MLHSFFRPILSRTEKTHIHTHSLSLFSLSLNYKNRCSASLCTSRIKISLNTYRNSGNLGGGDWTDIISNNDNHDVTHSFTQSHTNCIIHVCGIYARMYWGFWKKASSGIVEGEGAQSVKCASDGRRDRRPIYKNFSFCLSKSPIQCPCLTHPASLRPNFSIRLTYVSIYEGCSESTERLRIQPAQLFHFTRSVMWYVQ